MILTNDKVVCVDVDDTLVLWEGLQYRAHEKHVEALKRHKLRNHFVIVWSAGGSAWAKRVVEELKLTKYVDIIMGKPTWYIDDKAADEWMQRYFIEE